MFLGPVDRKKFIVDDNWNHCIKSAFSFSDEGKFVVSDVSAVLMAAAGKPGLKDWIAVVQIDGYWWYVMAGYPEGGSWEEGIGMAKKLSSDMSLAANSPLIPGAAIWRLLPQMLRLHTECKIDISGKLAPRIRSMVRDGRPESIIKAVKEIRG